MLYLFIFLFGLIIGSFLNCLIWRLHKQESLLNRSYCPKCRKQIAWYDNIPLLSYSLLGGRCRNCKKTISWQYPVVELATGILFLLAFILDFRFMIYDSGYLNQILNLKSEIINLIKDWFLISVMIIIFVQDLRWYVILDKVTLPACLIVLLLNLFLGYSLWNLMISGIISGSFFLLQFVISGGKWIGGGDIRLGLLMGLALGWPQVLVALLLAYLIGSMVSLVLVMSGKKGWKSTMPLGIFLSTATVISLFWAEQILNWYLGKF